MNKLLGWIWIIGASLCATFWLYIILTSIMRGEFSEFAAIWLEVLILGPVGVLAPLIPIFGFIFLFIAIFSFAGVIDYRNKSEPLLGIVCLLISIGIFAFLGWADS